MPSKGKVKRLNNNVLLKWIIENFPAIPTEYERSLDGPLSLLNDSEVQIKLFPRGVSWDCRKYISCFVDIKNVGPVELKCTLEITDVEGNTLAWQLFQIKCEQNVEIGSSKFASTERVLNKIARSKSDALIVMCYLRIDQSETCPMTELVARTLIGVNRCSFTWYLENLDSNYSKRNIMYFPQLTKLDFTLTIWQTSIEIAILKSIDHDSIFNRDDDERDRDDDYGDDHEGDGRTLVFKISFLSIEGKPLVTHQAWMDFDYHDEDSEKCFYTFKKDRIERCFDETAPLQCEITISCGTYLKHINPKRSTNRKRTLK